jgi:hypothetical protein
MEFSLSGHAREMLKERNIHEEWVRRTLDEPDWEKPARDDTVHYFKRIPEHQERFLRVVVDPKVRPAKVITVFFDRRARRPK